MPYATHHEIPARGDDLKYGCDVEFFLEYDGRPAPAELLLPFQGMLGTDNHGQSRGMRDTAEIRTRAFHGVDHIVRDIARALNMLYDHVNRTPTGRQRRVPALFLTGHYQHGRSIGGHVHFSSYWWTNPHFEMAVYRLHEWARIFMDRYDDPDQMTQRRRAGYLVDDWRQSTRIKEPQMGVELFHWEYRCWGSFLLSPLYCYAALALSKLIVLNVLKLPDEDTARRMLPSALELEVVFQDPRRADSLFARFPFQEPDLAALPSAIRELEATRSEMRDRWRADFMDLWREGPLLESEM